MPDWRDTTTDLINQGKTDGAGPIALVTAVREHIRAAGVDARPGLVMAMVGFTLGIPLTPQNTALRWRGFQSGPRALSDEEFERLLSPWF
jgi:hypothetical protein